MEKKEWEKLSETMKTLIQKHGCSFNYDGGLRNLLHRYAQRNEKMSMSKEIALEAVDKFVEVQKDMEDTCITTNAQLHLEGDEQEHKEQILVRMHEEKKLLNQAVAEIRGVPSVPNWHQAPEEMVKCLFEAAMRAVDLFMKEPTALVLFPDTMVYDGAVFGGFCGAPWGHHNNRTLKLKFRELNPHFELHVHTLSEELVDDGMALRGKRRMCVLFTYVNPW